MDFEFTSPQIAERCTAVYDARRSPFSIYGLYHPENEGVFVRMPREATEGANRHVRALYANTSGARIRFATDSEFVAVGAVYPPAEASAQGSALSHISAYCFDLYADRKHVCAMIPQKRMQHGRMVSIDVENGRYEAISTLGERRMREITLCFPSLVDVSEVYIGLEEGALIKEGERYANDVPVVFYGSSITQGVCASRSGNIYQNVLSRKFNFDYINLGFSSGCKAEDALVDYLCSLDMSMLVFDYDHNTPDAEYLRKTHLPALRRLREAHPDIPFVLMSKPNRHNGKEAAIERMNVIIDSYNALKAEYDAPVYFVNGQEIFESLDAEMMTLDNTHPTDFGFYCMAKALEGIFAEYFAK